MKYITTLLCILGFSIQTNAQNFGDVSALEGLNGKVLSIRQYFKSPDSTVSSKNQNSLITFRPDGKYTARYWLKDQNVDTYDLFYHTENGTRYGKTNFSKDGETISEIHYKNDQSGNPLQITVKNKSGETINIKKYQYEYDNQNNWIRCIETDDDNNVLTERQRDIIYQ